jgi:hypothetical protein
MADFLDICGVNVPCAELSMLPEKIGPGVTRSANATARANWIARKWHAHGKTAPMQLLDAIFLSALLGQMLDHWNFDADLFSDQGINTTATAGAPAVSALQAKYGAKSLLIHNTVGESVTYTVLSGASTYGITVIVWRYEGGAWHHYIVSATFGSGYATYKDGAFLNNALPTWLNVTVLTGVVVLQRSAADGADVYYDDLVVISAALGPSAAAMAAALYTFHNAQVWPQAPTVSVSGDAHPAPLFMLGEPADATNIEGNLLDGNGLKSNLRVLPFEMLQV